MYAYGIPIVGIQRPLHHVRLPQTAEGRAHMTSAGMSFTGIDWANSEATTLSCVACSHIEWFHDRPQKLDN